MVCRGRWKYFDERQFQSSADRAVNHSNAQRKSLGTILGVERLDLVAAFPVDA
jgi:hypothetical protein